MLKEEILKSTYQEYFDWWSPIDIANGSALAPMTYERFLETLLTFPHETWFKRWVINKIPPNKVTDFKTFIFRVVINNKLKNK